jgi:hypothetical protein
LKGMTPIVFAQKHQMAVELWTVGKFATFPLFRV